MCGWKKLAWDVLSIIVPVLLLFLVFRMFFLMAYIPSASMVPNLYPGQRIIVNKAAYWFGEPRRGDIVVYRSNRYERAIIHRIVGLPGDLVQIKRGKLYLNGRRVEEPYIKGNSLFTQLQKVPPNCYFIIGDNRDAAIWEIVPREALVGKAWICYWPPSRWGRVANYSLRLETQSSSSGFELTRELVCAILSLPLGR